MIAIRIGGERRELADADEQWINQQINRRQAGGEDVCVSVTIEEGDVNVTLLTPACASNVGSRRARDREKRVFDLWQKLGLDRPNFTGGNVVAFLKQVVHVLG